MSAYCLVSLGQRAAYHAAELLEREVGDPVAGERAVAPARHQALLAEHGA